MVGALGGEARQDSLVRPQLSQEILVPGRRHAHNVFGQAVDRCANVCCGLLCDLRRGGLNSPGDVFQAIPQNCKTCSLERPPLCLQIWEYLLDTCDREARTIHSAQFRDRLVAATHSVSELDRPVLEVQTPPSQFEIIDCKPGGPNVLVCLLDCTGPRVDGVFQMTLLDLAQRISSQVCGVVAA